MLVRILGSAAGGGVPQWNCRCPNCAAARAGSADVRPRTQSSVAVSADGQAWFLLNVSPDVRQQVLAFPALGPAAESSRGTAIAGCVLTDAELDHTAGLLFLREGGKFAVHCTATVRSWLGRWFPVEPILASFSNPSWSELPLDGAAVKLLLPNGSPAGLHVRAFEVDRHVPRFVQEDAGSAAPGSVVALVVEDQQTGGRLLYAPCVAALDCFEQAGLEANCVLLDGTFWDDDEPARTGIGSRTARQMGHLPVSGPQGSLDWLAGVPARHRAYVHINNTNPMLNVRGPEYRMVTDRGIRVGADGDSFEL